MTARIIKENAAAEKEEKADIQAVTVADEADSLPSEKCLLALAELRHARWFSSEVSKRTSVFYP